MKLYLDDVREAPEGWTRVRSVDEAILYLAIFAEKITEVSLDHDLGDFAWDGGDGYRVVDWIAERDRWPVDGVWCHSGNPVGRERIEGVVKRYGPYSS